MSPLAPLVAIQVDLALKHIYVGVVLHWLAQAWFGAVIAPGVVTLAGSGNYAGAAFISIFAISQICVLGTQYR